MNHFKSKEQSKFALAMSILNLHVDAELIHKISLDSMEVL